MRPLNRLSWLFSQGETDLGQAYNPRGSAIAIAKSEIAIKIGRQVEITPRRGSVLRPERTITAIAAAMMSEPTRMNEKTPATMPIIRSAYATPREPVNSFRTTQLRSVTTWLASSVQLRQALAQRNLQSRRQMDQYLQPNLVAFEKFRRQEVLRPL